MKLFLFILCFLSFSPLKAELATQFTELLPFVQQAPDQGETNTCWFVASTGAMELLLNKKDSITNPVPGGKNDLSESFLIWQKNFNDPSSPTKSFIEKVVKNFNWGQAVHIEHWPFNAFMSDGSVNKAVWYKHPKFNLLPRLQVPQLETVFLFSKGRKWSTYVLDDLDVQKVKEALVKYQSPVIINYNDNFYWHVVLIVGFDDNLEGECYEIPAYECNPKGAFYVRDSFGKRYEARAYNWFKHRANAAAVVKLK
jgi:C1A family cysteine protease